MILRALARQRHVLSGKLSSPSFPRTLAPLSLGPQQTRHIVHTVPPLGNDELDASFKKDGIGNLFTPAAFGIAWTEYQGFILNRLNSILSNDPTREHLKIKDLAIQTARQPNQASLFNHASMAHNNYFFFSGLSSETTNMFVNMPEDLGINLARSFGSLQAMRETMLAMASGMFGPGFVWLVQDLNASESHPATANNKASSDSRGNHFRLVNTYLAGSPYPGAHNRQQAVDMNAHNLSTAESINRTMTEPQNSVGSFGQSARGMGSIPLDNSTTIDSRYGGAQVVPVLCVNTWQQCYLHDFGVGGKRQYLARWWDHIDWYKVHSNTFSANDRFRI